MTTKSREIATLAQMHHPQVMNICTLHARKHLTKYVYKVHGPLLTDGLHAQIIRACLNRLDMYKLLFDISPQSPVISRVCEGHIGKFVNIG